MKEIERLKEEILKEYPRLDKSSEFSFACHSGVPCFNKCCGDVNIFLTPYDIIRLKHRLGITSSEFLSKYTLSPFDDNLKYPVILLAMSEDEKKACSFVTDKGCSVYEDRPWACRMYPLGLASPGQTGNDLNEDFYFLLKEGICKGFAEPKKQTVGQWIKDQGIEGYDRHGEDWKKLTTHPLLLQKDAALSPPKIEMFFMVCYNLDTFRDFLFQSTFLKKFIVPEETQKKIKEDDVELLRFGYDWLRFSLFGEKTMKIAPDVEAEKVAELKARQKLPREGDSK